MKPDQITYVQAVHDEALDAAECARAIAKYKNDPSSADPPSAGCQAVLFAQGNTCRSAPVHGEINGRTRSTPVDGRVETIVNVTEACAGGDCPIGFCYWKTIHGPFWQLSPSDEPVASDKYLGAFARIYAENDSWKIRSFSQPELGPVPPPGGGYECTSFRDIKTVPDPGNCGQTLYSVEDPNGTKLFTETFLGPS